MREGGALPVWCGPIRGVPGSRALGPGDTGQPRRAGVPDAGPQDSGTIVIGPVDRYIQQPCLRF
ncbi:hypothetical protein B0T26DRAFT_706277, partial [Lasiosphaeria miniovina]